jgi:hypothetical protein
MAATRLLPRGRRAKAARKGGGVADPATLAEGVYFFCWVGPKLEAVTDVTSEGFGR